MATAHAVSVHSSPAWSCSCAPERHPDSCSAAPRRQCRVRCPPGTSRHLSAPHRLPPPPPPLWDCACWPNYCCVDSSPGHWWPLWQRQRQLWHYSSAGDSQRSLDWSWLREGRVREREMREDENRIERKLPCNLFFLCKNVKVSSNQSSPPPLTTAGLSQITLLQIELAVVVVEIHIVQHGDRCQRLATRVAELAVNVGVLIDVTIRVDGLLLLLLLLQLLLLVWGRHIAHQWA